MGEAWHGVAAYLDAEPAGAGGTREHVAWGSFRGHASARQEDHPVAPSGGALQVVDDREHRNAAFAHVVQDAEELELMADVEMGARLVEEEHAGLLGQASSQCRELPLAGRERSDAPGREGQDTGLTHRSFDGFIVDYGEGTERPAVGVSAEGDPVTHRQRSGTSFFWCDEGQGSGQDVARPSGQGAILQEHQPRCRGEETRQRAHERRFSRGVRAHERHGLSSVDGQRHSLQDGPAAPRHDEIPGLEKCRHSRPSLARRARRK
jgi:hypothetical protein